jgi:hypothetical protein
MARVETIETINNHRYRVTRDSETNNILAQVAADPLPAPAKAPISKFQFRSLFSLEERLALDNYEYNTNLSDEAKAFMRTIHIDFKIADNIDLKHPFVVQAVQYLETLGIIGEGRAAQILAGQAYSGN